jgi:hypothetical protein
MELPLPHTLAICLSPNMVAGIGNLTIRHTVPNNYYFFFSFLFSFFLIFFLAVFHQLDTGCHELNSKQAFQSPMIHSFGMQALAKLVLIGTVPLVRQTIKYNSNTNININYSVDTYQERCWRRRSACHKRCNRSHHCYSKCPVDCHSREDYLKSLTTCCKSAYKLAYKFINLDELF